MRLLDEQLVCFAGLNALSDFSIRLYKKGLNKKKEFKFKIKLIESNKE